MNDNGLAAFDPDVLLKTKEAVSALASSPLLPEHLRGRKKAGKFTEYDKDTKIANLLLVADAARAFRCNMLMLAKASFVIGSSLDFDGRVYAALANTSGFLVHDLDYRIVGEKNDMRVIVTGQIRGEPKVREAEMHITTALANGMTDEWKRNPQQMLCYSGARQWVRRHLSKVLLGFSDVSPDELEPTETTQADTPERLDVDMPTADFTAAMIRLGECLVQQQLTLEVNRAGGRNGMTDTERDKIVARARELWPSLPSREKLEQSEAAPVTRPAQSESLEQAEHTRDKAEAELEKTQHEYDKAAAIAESKECRLIYTDDIKAATTPEELQTIRAEVDTTVQLTNQDSRELVAEIDELLAECEAAK